MSTFFRGRTTHDGRSKAEQHIRALERCRCGHHSMRTTLTPGEELCTTCGLLTYCPSCMPTYLEQKPTTRAHALVCVTHRQGATAR